MTSPDQRDQDAEPPTPDGEEPEMVEMNEQAEPGSHPDPDPGASAAAADQAGTDS